MQAGALNRKILIQKRTQTQDAAGQLVDIWTDVVTLWAWVKTASGITSSKAMTGQQDGVSLSIAPYSFRIHYRPTITNDMRVVYGGMNFDIRQIRHDLAGHDWTDIVAEQGGNDG